MLDINHILNQSGNNIKIFYAQSGSTNWQTWQKPRGCNYVWIMCIGSGAGGGSGQGTVSTTGSAGSGGGPGAIAKVLFPSNILPDTLFIQPGLGGTGSIGTAGATVVAGAGNISWVAISPISSVAMNVVCASGLAAATGGTAESTPTNAVAALLLSGTYTLTAGVNGIVNSPGALFTSIVMPGCGGGAVVASVPAAGFSISAVDNNTFTSPAIPGGAATGVAGLNGLWFWKPFFGLGGSGGGANLSGAGGNGGNGAYGCGGGGGGCGSTTGGNGGNGGDGLVIIATF